MKGINLKLGIVILKKYPTSYIHDIWLLSQSRTLAHFHNPKFPPNITLIDQFFKGLQKFLDDLGGGEFYHIVFRGKSVFGLKIKEMENVLGDIFIVLQSSYHRENKTLQFLREFIQKVKIKINSPEFTPNQITTIFEEVLLDYGIKKKKV